MIQHTSPISGVATYNNQYVLTAGYDNQVILWDSQQRTSIARGNHDHLANQCTFSPCGQFAASSSSDYSVRLWALPTMRMHALLSGHTDDVEGIAFHPIKALIATCSRDKTIGLFDYTGRMLKQLHGHTADVISVAWQNDSNILISSSDDGTIKRWDTQTGEIVEDIDMGGVETDTVVIGQDGTLYAGNDEGQIIVISEQDQYSVEAHEAGIKRLVYDAHQNLVVSLSYDRTFTVWQCSNGTLQPLLTDTFPSVIWPRSCAFLNDTTLVFVTFGSCYAEYNLTNQQWKTDHIENTQGYNAVCEMNQSIYSIGDAGELFKDDQAIMQLPSLCNFLQPFAEALITGGQTGQVFDALTGKVIYQHHSPLNCATTFKHNGQLKCIVGTYTGEGLLLGINHLGVITYEQSIKLHHNAIKGITASGNVLMSICADAAAAFHHTQTLKLIEYQAQAHDKIANGCDSSKNGVFVSVSRDLKLRVWYENSGEIDVEVVNTPSKNSIKCVAISHCGRWAALGNYTGHVGLYDITEQQWVYWYHPSAAGISSITTHSDGSFILSSYDGQAHTLHTNHLISQHQKAA